MKYVRYAISVVLTATVIRVIHRTANGNDKTQFDCRNDYLTNVFLIRDRHFTKDMDVRSRETSLNKRTSSCKICLQSFVPDKRHPRQKICFNETCRRKARIATLRKWRKKYPEYFKNRADNIESMRAWRKANPYYYRQYRKNHPELKRKNREYVRAHREKKLAEGVSKNKNEYLGPQVNVSKNKNEFF